MYSKIGYYVVTLLCEGENVHKKIVRFHRSVCVILTLGMTFAFLAACSQPAEPQKTTKKVEIAVVSSFGGEDGYSKTYEEAFKAFEAATGHVIKDASAAADEDWKAKVMSDFEAGAEPDVLFYFTGADSNKIVQSGKVVPIDEIRKVYPNYASNMREEMFAVSPVDGRRYGVPISGYLESLFINKKVLAACGIKIPDYNYTWEQFLLDCDTILQKGYVPVSCSLQREPHYWFEFSVYNHGNAANHLDLPTSSQDAAGQKWVAALNDIKLLYERGYFPKTTNTSTEIEANNLFLENKAAFMVNGTWKLGWFRDNAPDSIDNFAMTFFPAQNERRASDIIGGFSMGYFITTKAWDNPEKQAACVGFVEAMTSDENVRKFSSLSMNALEKQVPPSPASNELEKSMQELTKSSTSIVDAVQDTMKQSVRSSLFADIPNIVTGDITPEEAIDKALLSGNTDEE